MSPEAWPTSADELERVQRELAIRANQASAWSPPVGRRVRVGAVFVATARGAEGWGTSEDEGWAGTVIVEHDQVLETAVTHGTLGAPYAPGRLALREGPLLEKAVRGLSSLPDVLMVNASGRDHPRRAGLAIHVGAMLDVATLGVTDRPLLARASDPGTQPGAFSALTLDGEVVGYRVRLQAAVRPVVVHAGWGVSPEIARDLVLATAGPHRTPRPLALARELARTARAARAASTAQPA